MTLPSKRSLPSAGKLTSKTLAKAIFSAELPEQAIRELPAQSLYMALRHNGLQDSFDLIEIATLEQTRTLLDFDLWTRDRFNEENFWEWLGLADHAAALEGSDDAEEGLRFLQKLLKVIDLKLVALMLDRHVQIDVYQEPTEQPPGPGFYTPDKGFTWICIKIEDGTKHFYLARFLALIFETDAKLFYQIIAVPSVSTESMLEEESFQDRCKRLSSEGVPDKEISTKLNSPLDLKIARAIIAKETAAGKTNKVTPTRELYPVEPLIYDSDIAGPLAEILTRAPSREAIEAELTMLLNAAIVHWSNEWWDNTALLHLTEKVKGAISNGMEIAQTQFLLGAYESYQQLELTGLYQLGLGAILPLRRLARNASEDNAVAQGGAPMLALISALKHPFPDVPAFFSAIDLSVKDEFMSPDGKLQGGERAISSLADIEAIERLLGNQASTATSC